MEWGDLQRPATTTCLQQLVLGNDDAFAIIVDRYQRLISTAWLISCKKIKEAEDVVQIVFLDVFRKKGLFDPSKGHT